MKSSLNACLCVFCASVTLGCVNLDQPKAVASCAKSGTCGDNPDGLSTDLASSMDRAGSRIDAAVDFPVGTQDSGNLDAVTGTCWTTSGPIAVGTECRRAVGPCDLPEVCDGINPTCPPDKFASGGTLCRAATGDCDLPESCTGVSPVCPADLYRSVGAVCRISAGPCDVAESCSGNSPQCPKDEMAPALTVCRESTDGNLCDPAETCTGSGAACPEDVSYPKPLTPVSVKAEAGVMEATISWAEVAGASGYNVKRSDTSNSGYTIQGLPPTAKGSPYLNTGLTGASTYYYVVTAINTILTCESDPSIEVMVKPTGSCVPPLVPTVTAIPSNGKTELTWTASDGAISYSVARSITSGTGYATIAVVTTGTSFTDLNVNSGTTYYYVVRASNEVCTSSDSAEVSATLDCTPPPPPTDLVAIPSNGSVALSWGASLGAVSYRISRSTVAGSGYTLIGTSKTTSYTDTTVTNGTTYHYVIAANNEDCSSANSAEASSTPACMPPSIPSNVSATAGNTQIVLAWDPSSGGAVSYEVSRATAAGGPYTSVGKPSSAGFTDTKLTNGTTYYYVVTASNGACSSARSVEISAAPVCTPPSVPTGVKATPGDGKVSLSWTASGSGPSSYTVSRAEGTEAYAVLGTPTTTSFTDTTAVNGHTYSYVVSASNGTCSSDGTAAVTATPVAACTQAAPTGLSAVAASQKVTLSWTAAAGATDYGVSRSTTSGSGYTALTTVTAPTTTFVDTDTTLKIGTTYYYVVTANNATCSSPYSTEASAIPVCTPPATPSGVSANADTSDGSVTISWSTVADATGYAVSRSTTLGGTYTEISSNQTAVNYKDTGCASGTTCYYKVRAMNVGGTCVSADSAAVPGPACKMPGIPTGLNKVVGVPSPGPGNVTLTWTASSNAESYEILRSTTSGSGYAAFKDNTSTGATFTDRGLTNDTSYFYVITARNGGASCASANSAEIQAVPRECQILPGSVVSFTFNSTDPVCFVTCWDMAAGTWGCNNFNTTVRSITVNNRLPLDSCGIDPGAKSIGAYTIKIGAGGNPWDSLSWWSTGVSIQAHDCP